MMTDGPLFYNSVDGGQYNIPVEWLGSITYQGIELHIVAGAFLSSETSINGCGVLVVESHTLSRTEIASVTQLR